MLLKAIFLVALVFQAPVHGDLISDVVNAVLGAFNRVPIGTVVMFAGNNIPDRWLLCNGQAVKINQYNWLYAKIGVTYGAPNATTFNVPDFRTRFPRGLPSGGSSGVTGNTGGQEQVTLDTTQLPSHTHGAGSLGANEAGAHTHDITDPEHNHGGVTGTGPNTDGPYIPGMCSGNTNTNGLAVGTHTHTIPSGKTGITINSDGAHTHTVSGTTGATGGGQPVNILPPYQNINFIIYAGHCA